jgi:hypothetical protein
MSSNFVPRQDTVGPRLSRLSARAATITATIQFGQKQPYIEQLIDALEKEFDNVENQAA